jgi:isopentenyl-diphosphate delta-isomerase
MRAADHGPSMSRPEGTPAAGGGRPSSADRKRQQLELVRGGRAEHWRGAGWEDVHLVPSALPPCSPDEVDLHVEVLGRRLAAPIVLAGMTGGFDEAERLNATLGEAAEALGLGVGVGSQRVALRDPSLRRTFAAVRRSAPSAFVLANLGVGQLVDQDGAPALGAAAIRDAVEMVGADALAVHLNAVQELVQPEGDRRFDRLIDGIARAVDASPVPVVAKETGAGMDREAARALVATGVSALDVGGVGGTSFVRVERRRGELQGDDRAVRLGGVLADWGIPTAASVLEVRDLGVAVVATGGVRTGLDAASALALRASLVGIGRPAAEAASHGTAALVALLEDVLDELRVTLALAGARTPGELRAPVLSGFTLEWARQRDLLTTAAPPPPR